ncbi:MAG: hypothetical protein IPM34_11860 [Saprospiraceae bacterium]|nr:hypothetical protein [Saprospiraceae bacterium]
MNKLLCCCLVCFLAANPVGAQFVRCNLYADTVINKSPTTPAFMPREQLKFQLVFHILYTSPEENISLTKITSQVQVLNAIMNQNPVVKDLQIPAEFRTLKASPQFHFCIADKDPLGNPSSGITRTPINDHSLACRKEFGMRSLMHKSLGGVDVWDPKKYINVYVINREQCPVLGEAVFPWNATAEEDGVIIHYAAFGFSGNAHDSSRFDQGKTLVHELGHYFGLYHLSRDKSDCSGDDEVNDTPVQAGEYFGCPGSGTKSCGTTDMYMNYMSLVNDDCMYFFTAGQVNRMRSIIQNYRNELPGASECLPATNKGIGEIVWTQENGNWMLYRPDSASWTADIGLYDVSGKFIWKSRADNLSYYVLPDLLHKLGSGLYFVILRNEKEQKLLKFFNP